MSLCLFVFVHVLRLEIAYLAYRLWKWDELPEVCCWKVYDWFPLSSLTSKRRGNGEAGKKPQRQKVIRSRKDNTWRLGKRVFGEQVELVLKAGISLDRVKEFWLTYLSNRESNAYLAIVIRPLNILISILQSLWIRICWVLVVIVMMAI